MQDETLYTVEYLTDLLWQQGQLYSQIIQGKEKAGTKFSSYFNYTKPNHLISPAHALDLIRGRKAGCLRLFFKLPEDAINKFPHESDYLSTLGKTEKNQIDKQLFVRLREIAEKEAIALCVQNLREHLMGIPAGKKIIMGIDTTLRSGVKVAVINGEQKLLDTAVLHLYPPLKDWYGSLAELAKTVIKHHVEIISIGVGAAFKESVRLINDLIKMYPDLNLFKRIIYTTSTPPYISAEPIEETFWTASSIARQVQDPLTELAKIDPSTINIGPYKEDVRPEVLKPALDNLIQDCLNLVNNSAHDPRKPAKRNLHHHNLHSETKKNKIQSNRTKQDSHTNKLFNSAMADAFAKLRMGEK